MYIIAMNVPPLSKSAYKGLKDIDESNKLRCEKALNIVFSKRPDVIFFTEQYGGVFNLVKKALQEEYNFYCPKGFKPSNRSFAGVVAAVQKGITVDKVIDGGALDIVKNAKLLGLDISGRYFMGAHYPQPSSEDYKVFNEKIEIFLKQKDVEVFLCDANTVRGGTQTFDGYKDVLGKEKTYMGKTKLDYVFVRKEYTNEKYDVVFDDSVIEKKTDSPLSDHAIIGIILKNFPLD